MKRVVAVLALALVFVVGAVAGAQATADELVARAKVKYDAEDTDGCIADCNKAIALDPMNTEAYCTRALAKVGGGDSDGALADCNKAVELNPRDSAAYSSRAFARYSKVDLDGSLADCDKAIELDPRNSSAYCHRGIVKEHKGDIDGALAEYDKAIEVNPKDSTAYDVRGLAKIGKGDLDGALPDFDKAIELNPRASAAYRNRGHCHFTRADYAAAAADYRSRLSLTSGDEDCALLLYLARRKSGEDGSPELSELEHKYGTANAWPAAVLRLYLGSLTPDGVVAAAVEGVVRYPGSRMCEAYFYVGQWHLLRGEKDKGVEFLKRCLAPDKPRYYLPPHTIHCRAARAELERLGEIPRGR